MKPTIRIANNDDGATVRRIVHCVLREYGLTPDPELTDSDIRDIERHFIHAGGYFCVVQRNGEIIATGGLHRISEARCELRKMYMVRAARGQGLGKKLLTHLIDQAKTLGFTEIVLETAMVLIEAIGLYKSFGFVVANELQLSNRCDQAMLLKL